LKLDVNTDATIILTAKLEKLHKSAFPSAVRNTLNQCAFDMKSKEIPNSASKNFNLKSGTKTLIKKSLIVDKAQGFDVKRMKSVVGFGNPNNPLLKAFINGLEKQEKGGTFDNGLRYLKGARGGRVNGRVRLKNYYDKSKVISGRSKMKRGKGTKKSKFVARAYAAHSSGKMMFIDAMKGNFLAKVKSISKDSKGKLKIKLNLMMMDREDKPSKVKATNFVQEAGQNQFKKIEKIYKEKADFQFKKHLK